MDRAPTNRGTHKNYNMISPVLLCDPLVQLIINDDPYSIVAPAPQQQNPALVITGWSLKL